MKIAFPYATPDTRDPALHAYRGTMEDAFRVLGQAGYDGVELMVRDPGSLMGRQIRALAAAQELSIAAVATDPIYREDGLSLCSPDPDLRIRAVDRLRDAIDLAAAAGAPINLNEVLGRLPDSGIDAAWEGARDSLTRVFAHAGDCGVTLAVAPASRTARNWINGVEETISWLANFGDRGRIAFDTHAASLEEPSVHAALIRAWPRLSYVRISESNRMPLGLGHYPLAETIRILAALGYDGYLSVDCRQVPDSPAAARRCAVVLAGLLAEVGG